MATPPAIAPVPASALPSARSEPRGAAAAKRLLLVKLGAIGDVIMAIPAAAQMHAKGYAIDWLASETIAPVLRLYPWIHVIAVDEAGLLRGDRVLRFRKMLALWRVLRRRAATAGPYDLCATLYYDRRYHLLTLPIRAARRVSLSWDDRAFRLLPGRHHTDEYARILSGRLDTETPTQLAPVAVPGLPAPPLPRRPGQLRVVLVPAGARNLLRDDALRRWPVESYVAVGQELLARGCEVVLVGGPEDRWASVHFAEVAHRGTPGSLTDLIGTLSLVETLALLDSADVTVTHDTGPLHLAGITSTGIVTIFGPTDPRGRLPQRADSVALWGGEDFACRPCYDGRDYAACSHNGCIRQITPATVLRQIEELIAAREVGQSLAPKVLVPVRDRRSVYRVSGATLPEPRVSE